LADAGLEARDGSVRYQDTDFIETKLLYDGQIVTGSLTATDIEKPIY